MSPQMVLHLLRNPHGHSEEEMREARLLAADMLERALSFWLTVNAAVGTFEDRLDMRDKEKPHG
jgi:hypothetical protein